MQPSRLEGINSLFLDYRRHFETGDVEQIADFYRFPLLYYREDGVKLSVNRDEFIQQVAKLLNAYCRLGVCQILGTVTEVIELNDYCTLASVRWTLLHPQGDDKAIELYSSHTRYLITEAGESLQIDGLIIVDESAKIREAARARKRAQR
ncbi:hypothetical protein MO867_01795 [Microbulbifer sp. OS29]|uniref:Uncharacterized protein n=1 Tax=Microbulbifer okhotskensis TaxID=2926617 RepID=A0A9X2EIW5_9GAMM|nr:hypothetical protein [Microbulbifer okhotskensis]MCO1333062.1 hypothetical protein [Microbulbifer okhotskensis]